MSHHVTLHWGPRRHLTYIHNICVGMHLRIQIRCVADKVYCLSEGMGDSIMQNNRREALHSRPMGGKLNHTLLVQQTS